MKKEIRGEFKKIIIVINGKEIKASGTRYTTMCRKVCKELANEMGDYYKASLIIQPIYEAMQNMNCCKVFEINL